MPRTELARLLLGAPEDESEVGGMGTVRFVVSCPGNAEEVLRNSTQVLQEVLRNSGGPWLSLKEWRDRLPSWFVESCKREVPQEEAARRLGLSLEQRKQLAAEEGWSLNSWLYWFKPGERCWYWWDAIVRDQNTILIAVVVEGWPFPWGSLEWLFRASGALSVQPEP